MLPLHVGPSLFLVHPVVQLHARLLPHVLTSRCALRSFFLSQYFLQAKAELLALLPPDGKMYKYMAENIFGPG